MDFDRIIRDVSALSLNLYDFALYTDAGIAHHRFQPCSNCLNSYSVAKPFIVAALGMLWDEGKIRMDDPISKYFGIPADASPLWQQATIEHAVTHTLGFDEGFLDIDTDDTTQYPTEDYLSMVFAQQLLHAPGTYREYSDGAFYLLSRLISRVCGEPADVFLNRRLLRPLRFQEAAWSRCPMDYPIGATGLYIGAQDMVKLGALYLNEGVWQGQRMLSKEWAELAIAREYELHPLQDGKLIGKGGMYGQMLLFSPDRRFASAWHAHESDREKRKQLLEYIGSL